MRRLIRAVSSGSTLFAKVSVLVSRAERVFAVDKFDVFVAPSLVKPLNEMLWKTPEHLELRSHHLWRCTQVSQVFLCLQDHVTTVCHIRWSVVFDEEVFDDISYLGLQNWKLGCYGHISCSSGMSKTVLPGTVEGTKRKGRQEKRQHGLDGRNVTVSQMAVKVKLGWFYNYDVFHGQKKKKKKKMPC